MAKTKVNKANKNQNKSLENGKSKKPTFEEKISPSKQDARQNNTFKKFPTDLKDLINGEELAESDDEDIVADPDELEIDVATSDEEGGMIILKDKKKKADRAEDEEEDLDDESEEEDDEDESDEEMDEEEDIEDKGIEEEQVIVEESKSKKSKNEPTIINDLPSKGPDAKLKPTKSTKAGGVVCQDITPGTGQEAISGMTIGVYYEGRLKSNGKLFDKCVSGTPFRFGLGTGSVIAGWDVGVLGMKVGGKRRLTCPPKMAYGKKGAAPQIPPNSVLIFDITLKSVKEGKNKKATLVEEEELDEDVDDGSEEEDEDEDDESDEVNEDEEEDIENEEEDIENEEEGEEDEDEELEEEQVVVKEKKSKKSKKNNAISAKDEPKVEQVVVNEKKSKKSKNKDTPNGKDQPKVVKATPSKATDANVAAVKGAKDIKSGGVVCQDLILGKGREAVSGSTVGVYYDGSLKINNKMFDKCKSGTPFKFQIGAGSVIAGWDIGISGMKVGGKRKIICPPKMGYGKKGSPPDIPPNAVLIFYVTLESVTDGKKKKATLAEEEDLEDEVDDDGSEEEEEDEEGNEEMDEDIEGEEDSDEVEEEQVVVEEKKSKNKNAMNGKDKKKLKESKVPTESKEEKTNNKRKRDMENEKSKKLKLEATASTSKQDQKNPVKLIPYDNDLKDLLNCEELAESDDDEDFEADPNESGSDVASSDEEEEMAVLNDKKQATPEDEDDLEEDCEEDDDDDEDEEDDEEMEEDEEENIEDEEVEEEQVVVEEKKPKKSKNKDSVTGKDKKKVNESKVLNDAPSKGPPPKLPPIKSPKDIKAGGVVCQDIFPGTGQKAFKGKTVGVYYEGRLQSNSKIFDKCTSGTPFRFRLGHGSVITGWDVGVAGMKVGGKRRITCPPKMAYGKNGYPPTIPGNAVLIFDVTLKSVQ